MRTRSNVHHHRDTATLTPSVLDTNGNKCAAETCKHQQVAHILHPHHISTQLCSVPAKQTCNFSVWFLRVERKYGGPDTESKERWELKPRG